MMNQQDSVVSQKWGEAADDGFQALPHSFFTHYSTLGLSPSNFVVLAHLLDYWWTPDLLPYIGTKRLAEKTGMSERTVQRSLQELERIGFAVRKRDQKTGRTHYQFDGLVARLNFLVREEKEKQSRK